MNRYSLLFLASILTLCAAASRADDGATPAVALPAVDSTPTAPSATKQAPASAAPAAPAVAPEAKPVEAQPADTKPKEEAVKAPEPAPVPQTKAAEEKSAEKPLQPSAAKLQPVVDAYQKAHDEFLSWLKVSSDKLATVDQKVDGLKSKIAENEARITKLKMDATQGSDARIRDLDIQTKGLWSQLKDEQVRQGQMSRALGRAAEQKVKELDRVLSDAVEKASAQVR